MLYSTDYIIMLNIYFTCQKSALHVVYLQHIT